MRNYLALILLLFLTACNLIAQEHNYKLTFYYNDPVEQVTYYNVFIVELEDTLATPFVEGVTADQIRNYQIGSPTDESLKATSPDSAVYYFSSPMNGKWLQAACTAVNAYGESDVAISNFLKKEYMLVPSMVKIRKLDK